MNTRAEVRYRIHPEAAHRVVAGEVFVVTGDRAFHRLHVATAIDLFGELAKNGASARELAAVLTERYQVSPTQADQDVQDFVATLLERQLAVLEQSSEIAGEISAPSRDDKVKS